MKAPLRHLACRMSRSSWPRLPPAAPAIAAEQLFVRPGRFDYLSCPELVAARQSSPQGASRRLKTLIERAEKESVGVLMAAASYRGELLRAQGEQKMLAEVIQRKELPPGHPARPAPSQTHAETAVKLN